MDSDMIKKVTNESDLQKVVYEQVIGEDRPTRGVPSYSNHVTSQNYLRHELRQALEAELNSNSMKIEGIKKESNQ